MRKLTIKKAKGLIRENATLNELAHYLLDNGYNRREVADMLAEAADDAIDWSKVVQGPAGAALEAADGPALRAACFLLLPWFERKWREAKAAAQERLEAGRPTRTA